MEFITTTQLRTQAPKILAQLKLGKSIRLVHRSKIVGSITPEINAKTFNPELFFEALRDLPPISVSSKQADKNYHEHIMKKYGQGLS